MNIIRVAATTINTTPLDWEGNTQKILGALTMAKNDGIQIICFPELCLSGYGCEDMFLAPGTAERAYKILTEQIAPATKGIFACVGLPTLYKGTIINTVASIQNGLVLALHAKAHLAGDGIHYEPRWFKPWTPGHMDKTNEGIPIGDIIIQLGNIRIGYEICEDAWVAQRPGHQLSQEGANLILNPSASHFAFGKLPTRQRFVLEGSRAFHCAYVYSNLVGNEAGRVIYDGGAMIASCGEMLAQGPRFAGNKAEIYATNINFDLIQSRQANSSSRAVSQQPTPNLILGDSIRVNTTLTTSSPQNYLDRWENSTHLKEEEFTRAITLAIRDYMHKSGTNGFVVSLSGGADSTAVSCLVHYMAQIFGKRTHDILTTVYQATKQSSDTTQNAAQLVAEAIGAKHHNVNVQKVVDEYLELFEIADGEKPTWENNNIALQNIQARARGPLAWMLANVENKLLLSTSNRSEAAVGYATMDGDTCGALTPVAGVDKPFLHQWLYWVTEKGPQGLKPIPAVDAVTCQKPTAELAPIKNGKKQTDEEDLMPYSVLVQIENYLIRDKFTPEDTVDELVATLTQFDKSEIEGWVLKFQRLWRRNQWKRDRYAPAFHVDDKNLDPRSWCRYPLLSGPVEPLRHKTRKNIVENTRDDEFWKANGVVSNDSTMIQNALLNPNSTTLYNIAAHFGVEKLDQEWQNLKNKPEPNPEETFNIQRAEPIVSRCLIACYCEKNQTGN